MGIKQLSWGMRIALAGGLLCVVAGGLALAIDTPADAVLGEIQAINVPEVAPEARRDPLTVQRVAMMRQAALEQRARLIGDLYKIDPDRAELARLLPERWQMVLPSDKAADAQREINRTINLSKNKDLVKEAAFYKVYDLVLQAGKSGSTELLVPAIDDFIRQYPRDDRGADMLAALADMARDLTARTAINDRIIANYPASPFSRRALIERRRAEGVGKPFEVEFVDAIRGEKVSSESLKGKILVIDFWATWCGPCVATIPEMKSLYAQYKDQGVEFIGISKDDPEQPDGARKFLKFVAEHGMDWPQYYGGKQPSAIEFAEDRWGILTIPAILVVDATGKVISTDATGQLDVMIPALLAQRASQASP